MTRWISIRDKLNFSAESLVMWPQNQLTQIVKFIWKKFYRLKTVKSVPIHPILRYVSDLELKKKNSVVVFLLLNPWLLIFANISKERVTTGVAKLFMQSANSSTNPCRMRHKCRAGVANLFSPCAKIFRHTSIHLKMRHTNIHSAVKQGMTFFFCFVFGGHL